MKSVNAVPVAVAVAGGTAVLLGAFGAHALSGHLAAQPMSIWHTAVDYQFWHALALALAAFAAPPGRARGLALRAFAIGIVLFSGSLYALALGAPHWIGVITPLGGIAFIVGWIALGLALRARVVR
jgi:uncharacterized membrane protein YgdD (TMEM256/DUF423 family)